jgi:hypothetical protein
MSKTEADQRQETINNLEYHKLGAEKARAEIEALTAELERKDKYSEWAAATLSDPMRQYETIISQAALGVTNLRV